jgi:B-cell receptor-associated protein 31
MLTLPNQVFGLLVFEMLLFLSLIVPMPFKIKRGLFEFISSNPLVAKLQYGMKVCIELQDRTAIRRRSANIAQITFIFILILFVDSVNRVYRVQLELTMAKKQGGAAA